MAGAAGTDCCRAVPAGTQQRAASNGSPHRSSATGFQNSEALGSESDAVPLPPAPKLSNSPCPDLKPPVLRRRGSSVSSSAHASQSGAADFYIAHGWSQASEATAILVRGRNLPKKLSVCFDMGACPPEVRRGGVLMDAGALPGLCIRRQVLCEADSRSCMTFVVMVQNEWCACCARRTQDPRITLVVMMHHEWCRKRHLPLRRHSNTKPATHTSTGVACGSRFHYPRPHGPLWRNI